MAGTDFPNDFDGSFSLLSQNLEELSPRNVTEDTGKVMTSQHPSDVQILNVQRSERSHKRMRRLVREVLPCPLNSLMGLGKKSFGFLAAMTLQRVGLLTIREGFAVVTVEIKTLCKRIVVQMTARFQSVLKQKHLLFCGIYPILKRALHPLILPDKRTLVKSEMLPKPVPERTVS